jgi:hypothetical protein
MSNGLATRTPDPRTGRRLRHDRGGPRDAKLGLGWSLALGLGAEGGSLHPNCRRAEARRESAGFVCRLAVRGWFSAWGRDALIVNISRGGALVFLDEPPPARGKLALELETPRRKVSVPATALEVRTTRQGQAAVRIAFSRRWPYDLFEAAVCGLSPADPRSRRDARPQGPEREFPGNRSEV